jgi:hypothetical protein
MFVSYILVEQQVIGLRLLLLLLFVFILVAVVCCWWNCSTHHKLEDYSVTARLCIHSTAAAAGTWLQVPKEEKGAQKKLCWACFVFCWFLLCVCVLSSDDALSSFSFVDVY